MSPDPRRLGQALATLLCCGLLAVGAQAGQDATGDARLEQQLADVLGAAQDQADEPAARPRFLSPEAKANFTNRLRAADAEKREQVAQISKIQHEVNEQLAAQASPAPGGSAFGGSGFGGGIGSGAGGGAGGACGMRFGDMSADQQRQCAARISSICEPKCAGYKQAEQNGSMRASYEGAACLTACFANNVPDDYPSLEQLKASAHANYDQARKLGSNIPVFLNR